MLLGATSTVIFRSIQRPVLTYGAIAEISSGLIRLDTQSSRFILKSGIPVLERTAGEDDPFRLFHLNWSEIYWRIAADISSANPREILKTQFPLLALAKPKPLPLVVLPKIPSTTPIGPPDPIEPVNPEPTLNAIPAFPDQIAVFLYHTHTSESYLPESGKEHILNGKGDIVKVGEHLKKVLEEKYGLKSLHNEDIHDQYPFRESYQRSQLTLKKNLGNYPNLLAVLDVHRDATPGIDATCTIKGQKAAKIMIVVGTNRMGLAHPQWQKNHLFATKLIETMDRYYPGLSSGIVVSDARYNQHLHPKALIIEFGDQNSTLAEVNRSAELFADILVATLRQESLKDQ